MPTLTFFSTRTDHIDHYPNKDLNHILRAGNISGHFGLPFLRAPYKFQFDFLTYCEWTGWQTCRHVARDKKHIQTNMLIDKLTNGHEHTDGHIYKWIYKRIDRSTDLPTLRQPNRWTYIPRIRTGKYNYKHTDRYNSDRQAGRHAGIHPNGPTDMLIDSSTVSTDRQI